MPGNFQVSSKLPDGRIFVVAGETYTDFCAALESAVGIEESQDVLKIMAQSLVGAVLVPPLQPAAAAPGSWHNVAGWCYRAPERYTDCGRHVGGRAPDLPGTFSLPQPRL